MTTGIGGGVLSSWLARISPAQLLAQRFGIAPHAERAKASTTAERLDWDALARVLGSPADVDVLVVALGRRFDEPRPRGAAALRDLMTRAYGIVARRAERGDPKLADLADRLGRDIGGAASVQLFATPGARTASGGTTTTSTCSSCT